MGELAAVASLPQHLWLSPKHSCASLMNNYGDSQSLGSLKRRPSRSQASIQGSSALVDGWAGRCGHSATALITGPKDSCACPARQQCDCLPQQ